MILKQNQTAKVIPFLLVQSSDHLTGLTGASPTVTLSKNGAAFASSAGAVTEIGSGWYKVAGNATDTNTLGPLLLHATATSADASDALHEVVAYDPDDAVHLGLSSLPNAAVGATGGLDCTVVFGGTASAGSATSITLAGGSAVNNLYNHQHVRINSGTGAGQVRIIVAYDGTTKVAVVDRNWTTTPDTTSVFSVLGMAAMPAWNLFQGVASAGGATSVTLTGGSATSSIYNGALAIIMAGTGARQARVVTAYNGGTGVVTVDRAWQTNPDSTSVIVILAADLPGADGAGNLSGSVGSLGATAKTDVKSQITDALSVDVQSELSAVPSSTPTFGQILRWLYILSRNKITQTSTTQTVRNNADGADVGTSTVSDNGTTATRGKFS